MVAVGETRQGGPQPGGTELLSLRLYVAGDGPNSCEARANLTTILERRPGIERTSSTRFANVFSSGWPELLNVAVTGLTIR